MMQLTGYETIGPAGFGANGTAWNVRAADGTPGVAIHTAASAERLAMLQALHHPNLPEIRSVHRAPEGGIVVMELVTGPRLGTVLGAREWASPGEIAGLWRGLGDALAALHYRGLTHGDISPANVVMADGAHPVLIDIAGHAGAELGHEGFIPPEGGAGSLEARDVWALARTLLWSSGDDQQVRAALGRALAADPEARPSAREFAVRWQELGQAVPLQLPSISRLAEAGMRNDDGETWLSPTQPMPRWWRPVAVAAAVGIGIGVGAVLIGTPGPGGESPSVQTRIAELIGARDRAIEQLDPESLESVFVANAPSAAADRTLIAQLATQEITVEGYQTLIHSIEVVQDERGGLTAELEISPSSYERILPDGARETIAAGSSRCVRLTMTDGLISAIEGCT